MTAALVESLAEGRNGRVVVHEHRQPQAVLEHISKVEVRQVEVHARAHAAGGELDNRRHADAHALGASVAHRLDGRDDLVDEPVSARRLCGLNAGIAQDLVLQRGDGDLGPADVDADQLTAQADLGIGRGRCRRHAGTITTAP
jgi:hypothetical protein